MKFCLIAVGILMLSILGCSLSGEQSPTSAPVSFATASQPAAQPTSSLNVTVSAAPTLAATSGGVCIPRSDWGTYTVSTGDTLGDIANRANTTVQMLIDGNCLSDPDSLTVGQVLRVPGSVSANPTSSSCANSWFFTFRPGFSDAAVCPKPVQTGTARGLDFEGGRAYWLDEKIFGPVDGPTPVGTIFVVYNDGTWVTYPDWGNHPYGPVGQMPVPPAGRYVPDGEIGYLWYFVDEVRDKLGWAYDATTSTYVARLQEPPRNTDANNNSFWYLDHGKGLVLRFLSVNMGPNTWQLAGRY